MEISMEGTREKGKVPETGNPVACTQLQTGREKAAEAKKTCKSGLSYKDIFIIMW